MGAPRLAGNCVANSLVPFARALGPLEIGDILRPADRALIAVPQGCVEFHQDVEDMPCVGRGRPRPGGAPGRQRHSITCVARNSTLCGIITTLAKTIGTRAVAWWSKNWENVPMRPSEALAARRDQVIGIAAAHGARHLRVFGSVANGLDKEGSDLDLLVDLAPGTSLVGIVGLQLEIEDALGVKVDLCTERELHPALRDRILAEARPV